MQMTSRRWTATYLSRVRASDNALTDPAQAGLQFQVRVRSDGTLSRSFIHRFKWQGKTSRILVGHFPVTGLEHARKVVQEQREHLSQGIDPRRASSRRLVRAAEPQIGAALDPHELAIMERICEHFMTMHVRQERKRPEYVEAILRREILTPEGWAGRDIRTITAREVIALTNRIVSRGSRVMANRVFSVVHQLFRHAVGEDLMTVTPTAHILKKRPGGREKPRTRALSDKEIAALLACLDDTMRAPRMANAIRILLLTGQRRGELAAAKWADIDFHHRTWTVPAENSKTGAEHVVPLSDAALHEFDRLKLSSVSRAKFVFPTEDGSEAADAKLITRATARNMKSFGKAGIQPFTPHDLRRTVRTGLSALEIPYDIAERVLAHALPGMRGVYDRHKYLKPMREASDKWASHLQTLHPREVS